MREKPIPDIIYELLDSNQKIAVGGLGYFEVVHRSATYNAEKKILYPPVNFLYFRNVETISDNILVKEIAKTLNISENEAAETIELWINEICMLLAESQTAAFGDSGRFFIDENGKIAFLFLDNTNVIKDNYGLKEIYLHK